jgi:hypothetical protein
MGVIYMLTSPSGKKYIGQHKGDEAEKRMKTHISAFKTYMKKLEELKKLREENPDKKYDESSIKGCVALYNAFAKYGPENFRHEILHPNVAIEDLDGVEDYYILEHKALVPDGYNLRLNKGYEGIHMYPEINRKKIADSHRRYKEEAKGLPQYVFCYHDKEGYRGYKIEHHPMCHTKSFTSKTASLDILKKNCLEFLNSLETKYVKEERKLPVGICKPKSRDGYMAYFKFNRIKYSNYFTGSIDEDNLQEAIVWLDNKKAEIMNYKIQEPLSDESDLEEGN